MEKGGVNITTTAPTTIPPTKPGNEAYHNIRLPKYIKPINYTVELKVDVDGGEVDGKSRIKISVFEACKYIMVHAFRFRYVTGTVKVLNTMEDVKIKQFLYKTNQYIVLEALDELFKPKEYVLDFEFSYPLRSDLAGFYLSKYKTKSGEERYSIFYYYIIIIYF